MSTNQRITAQWILVLGTAWTSLIITPNYSLEPIDLPKMYALVLTSFLAIGTIFTASKHIFLKKYYPILILFILFSIQLALVLKFSGAPFVQQFFGTGGRNTGALTYLSLFLVLIVAMLVTTPNFVTKVIISLLLTGLATLVYGLMQVSGIDPVSWNNPHSSMIGFLGNPDFSSAFLGIVGAGGFCLIFSGKLLSNLLGKSFLMLGEIIALYLIVKSHAIQGIMIYFLGLLLSFGIYLYGQNGVRKSIVVIYGTLSSIAITVGVLGALKIGPLADHLYKISVRQRGFYWRAGREMLFSHPFFGVGMDSYGDWYYQKRSANAAFHSIQTSSNAAHNVVLDIGSNGGFPLLLIYLAVILLVLRASILILNKPESRNPYISAVIVSWIAYQAQSFVSINQIGLGVWGWLLGGVILGYGINSRKITDTDSSSKSTSRKTKKSSNSFILVGAIGLGLGFALVQPALQADHNYRFALQSHNGNQVISAALSYPEDSHRTMDAANQLNSSNLKEAGLKLARHVVKVNPRSYEAWYFISVVTNPISSEHKKAFSILQTLNPHDNSISKS